MSWRAMIPDDIATVYTIALTNWGNAYYESYNTFLDKYNTSPTTCFMYNNAGYLLSHPWDNNLIPDLNSKLPAVTPNSLFLHDIMLSNNLRGKGIAKEIINKLQRENDIITLISLPSMIDYWKQYGFFLTDRECDYGKQMIYWREI